MTQQTQQPKYKVLNAQRTQGEVTVSKQSYQAWNDLKFRDGVTLATVPCINEHNPMYKANAEYTALAVNNLHILAEALEDIINEMEEKRKAVNPFFYNSFKKAKEALNRIS